MYGNDRGDASERRSGLEEMSGGFSPVANAIASLIFKVSLESAGRVSGEGLNGRLLD